jgi:hypothetical protein
VKKHGHWLGWTALAAVVAIADYYGDRSMSDAFKILARDRRTMPLMIGVSIYVNAHLFGVLPDQWDMFNRVRAWVRTVECCSDVFENMV